MWDAFKLNSYKKTQNLLESQWQERFWIVKYRQRLGQLKNEENPAGTQGTEFQQAWESIVSETLTASQSDFPGKLSELFCKSREGMGQPGLFPSKRRVVLSTTFFPAHCTVLGLSPLLLLLERKEKKKKQQRKPQFCPFVNKCDFFTFKKQICEAYFVHLYKALSFFWEGKWSVSGLNLGLIWSKMELFKIMSP